MYSCTKCVRHKLWTTRSIPEPGLPLQSGSVHHRNEEFLSTRVKTVIIFLYGRISVFYWKMVCQYRGSRWRPNLLYLTETFCSRDTANSFSISLPLGCMVPCMVFICRVPKILTKHSRTDSHFNLKTEPSGLTQTEFQCGLVKFGKSNELSHEMTKTINLSLPGRLVCHTTVHPLLLYSSLFQVLLISSFLCLSRQFLTSLPSLTSGCCLLSILASTSQRQLRFNESKLSSSSRSLLCWIAPPFIQPPGSHPRFLPLIYYILLPDPIDLFQYLIGPFFSISVALVQILTISDPD